MIRCAANLLVLGNIQEDAMALDEFGHFLPPSDKFKDCVKKALESSFFVEPEQKPEPESKPPVITLPLSAANLPDYVNPEMFFADIYQRGLEVVLRDLRNLVCEYEFQNNAKNLTEAAKKLKYKRTTFALRIDCR